MKRWWLVIALLLSVGVNIGLLAHRALRSAEADEASFSSESESESRDLPLIFRRVANEMRLRGEIRRRFFEMQLEFLNQTRVGRQVVSSLQTELRRELVARDPDRELIDRKLEALAAAHFHLEKIFVDHLLDTREILEPRQERLFMRFMQRVRQSRSDQQQWKRDQRARSGGLWERPPGREPTEEEE